MNVWLKLIKWVFSHLICGSALQFSDKLMILTDTYISQYVDMLSERPPQGFVPANALELQRWVKKRASCIISFTYCQESWNPYINTL